MLGVIKEVLRDHLLGRRIVGTFKVQVIPVLLLQQLLASVTTFLNTQ